MSDVTPAHITGAVSDAMLAGSVTISADAVICVDEHQRIIFFNEGAEGIFGYSASEIVGEKLEILIPPRFRDTHAGQVHNFGRSGVRARRMGERGQISGVRRSGEEFPAEAAISHLEMDGRHVYSVVLRDVTEQRRAHETQRLFDEAGEILASSLGSAITLRNVAGLTVPRLGDGCILDVFHDGHFSGTVVAHIDERRAAELERTRVQDPVNYDSTHPVAEAVRTGETFVYPAPGTDDTSPSLIPAEFTEVFGVRPAGSIVLPLRARGQCLGVMSLFRETTPYDANDVFVAEEIGRRAALAIDNARLHDLVRAGIQARDDMIGIVSHDLRNPVNAIRMLTGVMLGSERDETISPEMRDYAKVIRQAAEQIDALIADLLDVTRVEAGRLSVAVVSVDTEELLSDSLRVLAPVAAQKSILLRLTAPDDMPQVMADSDRFGQAMSNLVGNAVKFSAPGSEIHVRVTVLGAEVVFCVSDCGNGMTPDQLARAFDRFWQSSRTDRRGAGLGLAITKGIVEAHGGRIWAESILGTGTTFYFTLPIAGAE